MTSQLVVRLPAEQKSWLEQEAEKMGLSVGELVREGIRLLQKKLSKNDSERGTARSLLKIVKAFHADHPTKGGPKDLSTNYKKYLYYQK